MANLEFRVSCWCHLNWNPHPCGYHGDPRRHCRCSPRQIENYRQRISGPLLDRIDLHVEVPALEYRDLAGAGSAGESSAMVRGRVSSARDIQLSRFKGSATTANAAMTPRQMRAHCAIDSDAGRLPEMAMTELNFPARAHNRVLKVARTLADLGGAEHIRPEDILEAIQFRSMDRKLFS